MRSLIPTAALIALVCSAFAAAALPVTLMSAAASAVNNTANVETITVKVSDTDFSDPGAQVLQLGSLASGTFNVVPNSGVSSVLGASIHVTTYGDVSNTLFGTGFPAEDFTFTAPDLATALYSDVSTVGGFHPTNLFALTIQFVLTLPPHTELDSRFNSVTASVQPTGGVPEPATLALLCFGLVAIGTFKRRRLG